MRPGTTTDLSSYIVGTVAAAASWQSKALHPRVRGLLRRFEASPPVRWFQRQLGGNAAKDSPERRRELARNAAARRVQASAFTSEVSMKCYATLGCCVATRLASERGLLQNVILLSCCHFTSQMSFLV